LFSRISDYASQDIFEIDEDEDEYEVLRRASSEIYFIEKMRVFEKTFGIDQLNSMVKKLEHQRKVRFIFNNRFLFFPNRLRSKTRLLESTFLARMI
jgi:hypothetical protein